MDINWGAEIGRAALYLGVPTLIAIFYLQWRWSRTCENNIRVLVAKSVGDGEWHLAPKQGGEVSIYNPHTDEVRTWPVNELATIGLPYPGIGFLPTWMQKKIRVAIVNEGDWEPVLNRSPHRRRIASPDVVAFLKWLAERNTKYRPDIDEFLGEVSTGPTREMVADPAMLGNLMRSSVLKALASVSNELMDTLKNINTRLSRVAGLNSTIVYIALGLAILLSAFTLFQVMQTVDTSDMMDKIINIEQALGIK